MVSESFKREMQGASDAELSALLLAVAELLAQRKGRPLGFVESINAPVAVLLGVGPLARLVRLANQGVAAHFTDGADRAGVIAQGKMAVGPRMSAKGREEEGRMG